MALVVMAVMLWQVSTVKEGRERRLPDFPDTYPEYALAEISASEIEEKVEALLKSMTEEEMYAMLGGSQSGASARGYGTGYVGGVPRLGVPVLRMWDGPKGVIGNGGLTTTSPASELALAASFSEELAYRYGQMTGRENRATAGNVQLGVQIDNIRSPFFMRGRDSLGEDAYLTSRMGNSLSAGVQSQHVISTLKHFAGYSSQFDNADPIEIDEQTLFEVYLAPYEYILKNKSASAVMTAWNHLNGSSIPQNPFLLKTVLRSMWGFDGFITVDWQGNDALSTHLGLDLEMPAISENSQMNIEAAIAEGTMNYRQVQEAVGHILTAMGQNGYLGLVQVQKDGTAAEDLDPPVSIELPVLEGRERRMLLEQDDAFALESAVKGAVLLKNEKNALPLEKGDDIALIGVLAEHTMNYYSESSYGWLEKMKGVREPLEDILGKTAHIAVSTGLDLEGEPVPEAYLYTSADCKRNGVNVVVDGETSCLPQIRMTVGTIDGKANRTWKNAEDGNALEYKSQIRMTTYLKAPETGVYELQLLKIGGTAGAVIQTDMETAISGSGTNVKWPFSGAVPTDEGMDIPKETTEVALEKGEVYKITVEGAAESSEKDLQLSLNWFPPGWREKVYQEALETAAAHEKVIYFAYDMGSGDSGSTDRAARKNRSSLKLRDDQLSLLKDVIQAAKEKGNQVIVVLNTALPVTMDWLADVDAVLEMWLPGQSGGKAAAQLLTGLENPGGKLPVTFPGNINDTQFGEFQTNYNRDRVNCIDREKGGEGIFYGYRWYDKEGMKPLFPFGYGLSYTEFSYSGLQVSRLRDGYQVAFTVTNTGDVTGTEVAQVYLGAARVPDRIQMAEYQLAGFCRVENLKPLESRRVSLKVGAKELSYWDAEKNTEGEKWTIAEGKRTFYVGASSDDFRLSQEVKVKDIEHSDIGKE